MLEGQNWSLQPIFGGQIFQERANVPYLSNMQKRNSWEIKKMKMTVYLKLKHGASRFIHNTVNIRGHALAHYSWNTGVLVNFDTFVTQSLYNSFLEQGWYDNVACIIMYGAVWKSFPSWLYR